ncbi:MAG: two-component system, sensor histidine kinase and response regulator [Solirubrobacteraceae bacterium]|nr:two-component system, sensor histidine kinase and response regulator [Solirubrobacteraceae bacterium]
MSAWLIWAYARAMPDPPRSSASPADAAGGLRRLLVVDDYAVNRQVVRAMLQDSGYAIQEAGDGQEALAAVGRARFDAVLMDCEMPVLDGYRAAAEIRRREGAGPRTPIIALTASARPQDAERARAAGMDLHVCKPVTIERLHAALDSALGATDTVVPAPDVAGVGRVLEPERVAQLRRLYPDEHALHEFATLVFDDCRARIEQLATAARAGDVDAVRRAAHILQGPCSLIGARRVLALLTDIESRARDGEAPGEALIAALQDASRAAEDALADTRR